MKNYQIVITVDPAKAALSGYAHYGEVLVDVPANNDTLTLSDRQKLALSKLAYRQNARLGGVWAPHLDGIRAGSAHSSDVPALLDEWQDMREAEAAKNLQDSQARINKAFDLLLNAEITPAYDFGIYGSIILKDGDKYLVTNWGADCLITQFDQRKLSNHPFNLKHDEIKLVLEDARIKSLQEQAEAELKRLQALQADKQAAIKAANEERQAKAEAEREESSKRWLAQAEAWINEHGTDSQKVRNAQGMLPFEELSKAMDDYFFKPLEQFTVYNLDPESREEILEISEESFTSLLAIEEALKDAGIDADLTVFENTLDNDGFERVISVMVRFDAGEVECEREFLL